VLSGSGGNQQIADGERSHLPGVSTIYQYIYMIIWGWSRSKTSPFRGMNIHLAAILVFTRVAGF
jgi:hypothetical protein